jgi:hypothetical protein
MVRNPDRQVGIKQAFTDRLYEIQWSDFAHLLMKGLTLDRRNTILLERPSPCPP